MNHDKARVLPLLLNLLLFLMRLMAGAAIALASAALWAAETPQEGLKYWPQWRGPLASGVAPQGNPPVTWSEGENVKWKVKCPGGGSASPIVWGDKVFILAAITTDKPGPADREPAQPPAESPRAGGLGQARPPRMPPPFRPTVYYRFDVLCFARQSGALVWQRTACERFPHEGYFRDGGGYACYSPVTDGKYVYALFGSRGLYCYDFDGNRKWEKELSQMNIVLEFGEGGSPALWGDTLIVNRDHLDGSQILAINKHTGETIWQAQRDEISSWSTPLIIEVAGKAQVVVSATRRVRSYDLATGRLLWECGGQTRNVIASPVCGFGMVFAASGDAGNSLQAIALGRSGDLTGSDAVKWHVNRGTPFVPSPLLYGNKLYVLSRNSAILSCYQAETGEANFFQARLEDLSTIYASPVGAADRVYVLDRNGKSMVIKRSNDLETLATNTLDDAFDASPAIAGSDLLLRGKEYLYCISRPSVAAEQRPSGAIDWTRAKNLRKQQQAGQPLSAEDRAYLSRVEAVLRERHVRGEGPMPQPRPAKGAVRPYDRQPDLNNVAYGPHERNVLDLWKAKSARPTPLVIYFHPGAFVLGDKTWIPPLLRDICLEKGISVATANYRYASQAPYPAPMEDCARAVQFLRLHAKEWNFASPAFAAQGGSAGAAMSLWIGFHNDMADPGSDDPVKRQSTRLAVVGSVDGQTTLDPRAIAKLIDEQTGRTGALATLFGVGKDEDLLKAERAFPLFEDASAINHLKPGAPPAFLYHTFAPGSKEPAAAIHNYRFGVLLKERMDEMGIPCVLRHSGQYTGDRQPQLYRDMVGFFQEHFPHEAAAN